MKFGIAIFPTEYAIPIPELAVAAEERGFESLWVAEHTHIPVRHTPFPGRGPLPEPYRHTMDPFVALTAAATVTTRLKVGTGICLLIQHDPIVVAKQVASLDVISNGRFLFGIGGGWNRPEMENHGTPPALRWRILQERVEAAKQIWAQDEAEYHGRFVDFDPIWSWPKPVQQPHPPVLLGGNGPGTLRRVVDYCDGWMPNYGDYLGRIPELQRMAAQAGRAPIPVTAYGRRSEAAEIELFLEAGLDRCIYYVSPDGRDAAFRQLEEVTRLTEPYR